MATGARWPSSLRCMFKWLAHSLEDSWIPILPSAIFEVSKPHTAKHPRIVRQHPSLLAASVCTPSAPLAGKNLSLCPLCCRAGQFDTNRAAGDEQRPSRGGKRRSLHWRGTIAGNTVPRESPGHEVTRSANGFWRSKSLHDLATHRTQCR